MQFKHPEFLYALFLLVIPIIVHLFQLRKFKKEAFTNVKFLKKVALQTRKSSQIKKWLTLFARLLALAAIIIAFAQPFLPHSKNALKEKETVVYIDNSFSMQQKGKQGELMKRAVQELLQSLPAEKEISVLTNNQVFQKTTVSDLKNDLLQLNYSSADASLKTIALKAKNLFSKRNDTQKQFIAISDFQQKNLKNLPKFNSSTEVDFIQLKGKNHLNFSIDSVFIPQENIDADELVVKISASRENSETVPISFFNGETLVAKSSAGFDKDTVTTAKFSLPDDNTNLDGRISLEDNSLNFDNTFFFSIQKAAKINVVALNADAEKGAFLKKIFNQKEFNYTAFTANQLDYNAIENSNFVILNELKSIPNGLGNILQKHSQNGGFVSIIPSEKSDVDSYNALLNQLQIGQLSSFNKNPLKITRINFAHPLYANVFSSKVTNFQYPSVQGSFGFKSLGNTVLNYNNGQAFLSENNRCYIFSAPIDAENSNFKNSPLIAPTFYNMAKQSLKLPKLFYTIGQRNTITIPVELEKDDVLHLKNNADDFIPQQHSFNAKVEITTENLPEKAGTYQVLNRKKSIGQISFNYDRSENLLQFADMSTVANIHESHDVGKFFTAERNGNEVDQLWKWFVIFAVFWLLVEVALLKFLK